MGYRQAFGIRFILQIQTPRAGMSLWAQSESPTKYYLTVFKDFQQKKRTSYLST